LHTGGVYCPFTVLALSENWLSPTNLLHTQWQCDTKRACSRCSTVEQARFVSRIYCRKELGAVLNPRTLSSSCPLTRETSLARLSALEHRQNGGSNGRCQGRLRCRGTLPAGTLLTVSTDVFLCTPQECRGSAQSQFEHVSCKDRRMRNFKTHVWLCEWSILLPLDTIVVARTLSV